MKTFFKGLVVMLTALVFSAAAMAADRASADEAVAMVQKGIAFIKANGKEKAYAEFDNMHGQFVDRDLYVMLLDMQGNVKAHGGNPKLIGKNVMEIKDADGKPFIKDMIEIAKKGKGWFSYKWPNSVTKAIEQKSTYIEKVDNDTWIGVGVYK